jgi:hypothetical protein
MLHSVHYKKLAPEGYVYNTYGHPKYLKHSVASVVSLRRYDTQRPAVLVCVEKHKKMLEESGLDGLFDMIHILEPERASIVGFKHNIHEYMFFERNMFIDSDIIWCKNPDTLWLSFEPYDFTITGTQISDNFFGGPKNIAVLKDILFHRRKRTLKRFGLTYLSRVQTGMIYAGDYNLTKKICELSGTILSLKGETHFTSRTLEPGRTEESCEWSMAMAMSKLNLSVYPWWQGHNSPQLDYICDYTEHDADFEYVKCKYYCDQIVYNLRGVPLAFLRKLLTKLFTWFPGKGDYLYVTPYCLHFGWYREKQPFYKFADRTWNTLKDRRIGKQRIHTNRLENIIN